VRGSQEYFRCFWLIWSWLQEADGKIGGWAWSLYCLYICRGRRKWNRFLWLTSQTIKDTFPSSTVMLLIIIKCYHAELINCEFSSIFLICGVVTVNILTKCLHFQLPVTLAGKQCLVSLRKFFILDHFWTCIIFIRDWCLFHIYVNLYTRLCLILSTSRLHSEILK
jgi:hypothetical protein